jgi:hypothetical protein
VEKLTSILAVVSYAGDVAEVLEKATRVARAFGAKIETMVTDAQTARVVASHCADQGYQDVALYSAYLGAEPLHEAIIRRALTARPDLVIKAPACMSSLRRFSFHDSDWDLANECPVPVLLVRGRRWGDPARFAAPVDVADEEHAELAQDILRTAGQLALGSHGNLDILYSEREAHDETVRMQRAVRLAQLVRAFHVGCERIQMFAGEPSRRLPPLMAARHYDVLVLGGQWRREGLVEQAPESVVRAMKSSESDVVLIKALTPRAALLAADSRHQQGLHQRAKLG